MARSEPATISTKPVPLLHDRPRITMRVLAWWFGALMVVVGSPAVVGETVANTGQEESSVNAAELTIEEARLERVNGSDIPYEVLVDRAGQRLSATDPDALTELGYLLWRAAVQGVQTDEVWDDRALYWARLKYKADLRAVADEAALASLERASRGMTDVVFSAAAESATRVVVTGFDPFHLDQQIDQSNPSGLAALALDGRTLETAKGPAHVEAAIFPVRFADFDAGMVEAFIEPLLANGVDLIVTISMGRDGFDLERFPGRRRSSAVPDNLNVLTGANPQNPLIPSLAGDNLAGPEFLEFTLPATGMVAVRGEFPVRDNRNVATLEQGDIEATALQALAGETAVRGSGGGYLSNEIAYRTLLANQGGIPMGHLHTPRLSGFDPVFERKVVAQIEAMLVAAVEALPGR